MPIYEFYCPATNKIYSFFARSMALAGKVPRCPDSSSHPMERLTSRFAISRRGRSEEPASDPAGKADSAMDSRMERTMMEMQSEFASMDEENPDPRAMARMMRKLSAISGEKMPDAMQEMIARMEAGEDPEALEAEYGDVLEGMEGPSDDAADGGEKAAAPRRRRTPPPIRDPVLYEMSEYVD